MAALVDFLKQNISKEAAATTLLFGPGYIKQYNEAQNKLKGIVKIMADWAFWTLKVLQPLRSMFVGGAVVLGFKSIGDAIQNIVRQTGSLEAALRRLQSIQSAQRGLGALLGSSGAAKQRVAELTTMSGKGPFSFEQLADANRQLEILTRGAYSSAQATQEIGKAAIATGNQIETVAGAVGEFYNNLHEGRPIAGAAENLRQLGVVSQQTANDLVAMNEGGASSAEVFDRLTKSINQTSNSLGDLSNDLNTVTAEHAKAAQALQEKFGAPWTAQEVRNTKNMTAAMQAIAPTVGRISEGWAKLFGGFTTVTSEMVKAATSSKFLRDSLERLAVLMNGLLTAAVAVATVAMPMLIPKISGLVTWLLGAERAASTLGLALRAIGIGGAIGVAVIGAAMLTGAIINEIHAHREATREIERQNAAFQKSNNAIKEQIANSRSLAEAQDSVSAAMNQVISAHQDLINVQQKASQSQRGFWERLLDPSLTGRLQDIREAWEKMFGSAAQKSAQDRQRQAQETMKAAIRAGQGAGFTGPALERAMGQIRERAFATEERQFRGRMEAEPGRRAELERARATQLGQRAAAGRGGVEERARVESRTSGLADERKAFEVRKAMAQQDLAAERASGKPNKDRVKALEEEKKAANEGMRETDAKMLKERLGAKQGSSIQKEAQAEQLRLRISAGAALAGHRDEEAKHLEKMAGATAIVGEKERERARIQMLVLKNEAAILKGYEDQNVELEDQANNLNNNANLLDRQAAVTRQTGDIDLSRRRAQREGRSEEAVALRNQEEFVRRFEELRQTLPEQEARQRALAETAESIQERVPPGGPNAVASSMARLGLGGGVYAPGGDPTLETQKQIVTLIGMSNQYLSAIAAKGEGVQ